MKSLQNGDENAFMIFAANASQDPQLKGYVPSGLNLDPQTGGAIVTEDISRLQNHLGALIENEQLNQINLIKERKAWSYEDEIDTREAGSFGDEANTLPEGWTPYQEELFQEGYGTDVDTGLLVSNEFAPGQPFGGGEVVGDDGDDNVVDDTLGAREQEIKQRLEEIDSIIARSGTKQSVIEPLMDEALDLRKELENINVNKVKEDSPAPITYETDDGVQIEDVDYQELDSSGIKWQALEQTIKDPDVAVPGSIAGATLLGWGINKVWKSTEESRKYVSNVLKMSDEGQIAGFLTNADVKKDMEAILKIQEKIDNPKYKGNVKALTQKIAKMEMEFAKKYGFNYGASTDDMLELIKNRDKWNLWKAKSKIMPILREAGYTFTDIKTAVQAGGIGRFGTKAFWALAPFEGGILAAEAMGAESPISQIGTGLGTAYLVNKAKNKFFDYTKDEISEKIIKNPQAWSKIGKVIATKAPWLATQLGLGGLASQTPPAGWLGLGIKTVGWSLFAKSMKDLYDIAKDSPELAAELYNILYEEEDGPEGMSADNIVSLFNEEYSTPFKTETTPMGTLFKGTNLPITKPKKIIDNKKSKELIREFKNKYGLNDIAMKLIKKINHKLTPENKKEKYKKDLNKELKKLGLLK